MSSGSASSQSIVPLVADIGDESDPFDLSAHHPHVVIHAAAHKHVALMEQNQLKQLKIIF